MEKSKLLCMHVIYGVVLQTKEIRKPSSKVKQASLIVQFAGDLVSQ